MGLLESASLRIGMPVEVRLLTAGSPQTPQQRDPHWELLLLLLFSVKNEVILRFSNLITFVQSF